MTTSSASCARWQRRISAAGWPKPITLATLIGSSRSDIKLTKEPLTRLVRPEPGLMVTFPSYFWHDTVPLPEDNAEQRLCLAFDLHPRTA